MRNTQNMWRSAAIVAILAATALYVQQRDLYQLHLDYEASEEQVRMIELELAQTTHAASKLEQKVAQLEGDPLELEAAIRKTKRLVREGETVFRVELPSEARLPQDVQAH